MKSGLYACAGASATASAAACAKRFDDPMTNESKVYFGLIPTASGRGGTRRRADQLDEVAVDPLAREVVRHLEDERAVVERDRVDLAEPRLEGRFVQRPS